jgi:hypothetical protein
MASSVPTAEVALYDGLAALTGPSGALEGVGVYDIGLWRDTSARDRIMVAESRDIDREIAALSPQTPFRETFVINVQFEVYRRGDDVRFVKTRLWELITEVEQYVLANKTLGGAVSKALPGRVPNAQAGPSGADEDTVLALATLEIECMTARVFLN